MTSLTRDSILSLNDIAVKELTIPEDFPVWGGNSLFIKPLTQAQNDEYKRRQFGDMRLKQNPSKTTTQQELTSVNIYGHDTWIFVCGVCDQDGKPLFTERDIPALGHKMAGAITWVAQQILDYSRMGAEDNVQVVLEEDLKNFLKTKS
jgi:hypothetical protein